MEVDYDVAIVGAGPAGAAAAYDLASWGYSVLLLDRSAFPRTKACAGALTLKTARALRFSVRPVVRSVCRSLVARDEAGETRRYRHRDAVCLLTVRSELDGFCLEKARSRGADFQVARFRTVKVDDDRVTLVTDRGETRCRFLLGADGAGSRVRRETGEFREAVQGFALEASVAFPEGDQPANDRTCVFHFDAVPSGYGWVFPKDDHWNVGLYSRLGPGSLGRRDLEIYLSLQRLEGRASVGIPRIVGHAVGLGGHRYRPGSPRVLLVGDAAGLVFPRWAEGIYSAVVSGQLAAASVRQAMASGESARHLYRGALAPLQRELRGRYRSLEAAH
jgi:geranylgeranyl reductase family protein